MNLRILRRLIYLDAHYRLVIAIGVGIIAFLSSIRMQLAYQLIAAWDSCALTILALSWIRIISARPRVVLRIATLHHSSRMLLFVAVLFAACGSLGAVGFLLSSAKGLSKEPLATHVLLAIGTVVISWLLVHTIFALHYSYLFYSCSGRKAKPGGLQFPDGDYFEPDYRDFAYFSFVIGMTSQVSDVQIRSPQIRAWALLHGMISFGFNAAILGLSINVLSGLF